MIGRFSFYAEGSRRVLKLALYCGLLTRIVIDVGHEKLNCNSFSCSQTTNSSIRVITVDDRWMHLHNIVPYDYDTSAICARLVH
jgi:hypothetical protein